MSWSVGGVFISSRRYGRHFLQISLMMADVLLGMALSVGGGIPVEGVSLGLWRALPCHTPSVMEWWQSRHDDGVQGGVS